MKKKLLSMLLVLVVLLGLLPMTALAAEDGGIVMDTGDVASYSNDFFLTRIVLKDMSGSAEGSGRNWTVTLPADTNTSAPLTFELTHAAKSLNSQIHFWAQSGEVSVNSEKATSEQNPAELTITPVWDDYGTAQVVVGTGATKFNHTKYTITLMLEGSTGNPNVIELGETKDKKYFVRQMTVDGATVAEAEVSAIDFSNSTKNHKATVDIRLESMPAGPLTLKLDFMTTDGAYITTNGGSREEAEKGSYTAEIDLTKGNSYVFVTYSNKTNSDVRGTYTVNFMVAGQNRVPQRANGVAERATVARKLTQAYTLDLSGIFTDADKGDSLTYTVAIDGADPIDADANYSFTPTAVGDYVLVFRASDGTATSEDTYTVNLTVTENSAPELREGIGSSPAAKNVMQYFTFRLDLSTIFTDSDDAALTYTVKMDDGSETETPTVYSFTPQEVKNHTLVFRAKDGMDEYSEEYIVNLTVAPSSKTEIDTTCVKHISGDTWLSKITLTGPAVEAYVWNVAAGHTETDEHILHIRLAEGTDDKAEILLAYTAGSDSFAGAVNGPSTISLNDGEASVTVTTKEWPMNTNTLRTYTLNFTNKPNNAPVVADDATNTVSVTTGEPFALGLTSIFSDVDGDMLTYTVKEGTNEAVATEAAFSRVIGTSGTHTFVFTATDPWGGSASHTVTVTAAMSEATNALTVLVPEGITPVFSVTAGYADNGIDIPGETLAATAGEAQNGITPYTVMVPEGLETISVRAEGWGGMAFSAVAESTVTLRKVQMNVLDCNNQPAENSSSVTYGDYAAAFGSNGVLLATGTEYVFSAVPGDTATFVQTSQTLTLEDGDGIFVLDLELSLKNPLTITVTTGAKAQLYKYNQYYSHTEFDAKKVKDNGDGTTTYSFVADTTSGSYIYRVSYEGKITKGGYLLQGQKDLTVLHTENDKANNWRLDDYSATGHQNSGVAEDSVLLNINGRNHLNLSVGQSKTLKAYRAWEIIKTSTENQILTPDFTYTILSGSDVVSLTEKASPSTADGDWMTLTALQEGVAIIEVTYDALEVSSGGPAGAYGASDPHRTGLVVVTVGGNDASVDFGIECFASHGIKGASNTTYNPNAKKAWDAEFDTLYFTGDSGSLKFAPTASGEIQSVAVSNDKGANWTTLTAVEGVYTAPIVPGNNVLRVTTAAGTAYQIVRGDKVEVKLAEVPGNSDEDGIIEAGERIRVTLVGLHAPIPKMAGNYNPGYLGNNEGYSGQHLNYTSNGNPIWGPGVQYNFVTGANYVVIDMPQDGGNVSLTDGYIGLGVIGLTQFTDGGDSHRNIPDAGCSTRGGTSTWHTRSILPEITLTVGAEAAPNTPPSVRSGAPTTATLELSEEVYTYAINLATDVFTDADTADVLNYTVKVNDGAESPVENGYYTLVRPETGTYTLLFTVSDGKATAEHTITLTVTLGADPNPENPPDSGDEEEVNGYVYVSFEDNATRVSGETGVDYPNPLGIIIGSTRVPYYEGDTIADVTLRLLDSKGMTYQHDGTTKSGFYLLKIGNFSANGILIDEFGEFDAGNGSGWMITQNGVFIGQGASEFIVKDNDVIEWQYTCQLGADIGDPYWDDKEYDGTGDKDSDEITVPISGDDHTIHVGATVEGTKATIDDVDLSDLNKVVGNHVDTGTVTIDFSGLESDEAITTVEIPAAAIKQIAAAVNDPANDAHSLEVVLSDGTSIEFDAAALKEKASQANGADITISIVNSNEAKLSNKQTQAIGSRPAYDINVTSGGKHISDMGGKITVHAPYELKAGERARGIVVYYVDDNGNKERCVTSYDPIKKRVNWKTDHLSLYMIGYDETLTNNPFTDVTEDAYYFDAVLWAVDEGITNGTSATTFSPDATCTRAQMVTFLWRAAGSPKATATTCVFTDVDKDAYYYEALLWAVENGITNGTSATTFSPDASCTRGQMATFLYRNAKTPVVTGTHAFADVKADAYYNDAVIWAAAKGITVGTSATTFSPDADCTRGQMVTFLYRYLAE